MVAPYRAVGGKRWGFSGYGVLDGLRVLHSLSRGKNHDREVRKAFSHPKKKSSQVKSGYIRLGQTKVQEDMVSYCAFIVTS